MAYSQASIRRPIAALLILVGVIAASGLGFLKLNSHYSVYFDTDDDRLIDHQEVSRMYSRGDSVFVVLVADKSFLNVDYFALLEDLSLRLSQQPLVSNVVSIADLGITGETLAPDGGLAPSRQQLHEDGRAYGLLLSEDELTAGILVQVSSDLRQADAVLKTVGTVRQLVSNALEHTGITAHYTGTLALNEAYIQVVRHDLARILPLLFLATFVVAAWLLGGGRAAVIMLPVGILSVVVPFGMAGWLNMELAAIHAFVPVMIISISMAGCMHVTLTYLRARSSAAAAVAASTEAVRTNLLPMSLANGTTALGFLALALSPSPPLRVVGYLVAIGVMTSFLLCITLLPALLERADPPWKLAVGRFSGLEKLATFVDAKRVLIVSLFALMVLPATWLVSRNEVSDNVFGYFVASHEFSRDTKLVDDRLSGINEVMYSVESGTPNGMFRADAIEAIVRFEAWLANQPEVNRVVSISSAPTLLEARSEGRLQERLDFYRDRSDEANRRTPLLDRVVSNDYGSSVLTAYLAPLDSRRMIEFDDRVHGWAVKNIGNYTIRSAGPTLMFASLGERNIRSMLIALTSALALAAVVLGIVLRSYRVIGIGVVCNLLPILLVFSVWALAVGQISLGAAVVLGMVLGILVDDTIYFLTAFRGAQQKGNSDPVSFAMRRIGPALIMTSMALVSGLSLGLLSDFGPIWNMSVLSATIIATALFVDLILLPALLHSFEGRRTAT